jgi:hypothetical protein
MKNKKLAEKIVKFIAENMERESVFLSPNPAVFMHNPYGLLDLLRDECAIPDKQIDKWMCEAQGVEQD